MSELLPNTTDRDGRIGVKSWGKYPNIRETM